MTKPVVYVGMDISGSSVSYRKDLFSQVDHVDEYVWYVSPNDTESETGDHFIQVRTFDLKELNQILDSLEQKHKYEPNAYISDSSKMSMSIEERFAIEYRGTLCYQRS